LDIDAIARTIREAVIRQHEIAIEAITLIPPATLPKTTSGKIQRSLTRQLWLEGALDVLG
jgi:acyl-coenzyme A synthetase/AMP-(fatty) acid ligase